jgi:hypothetical protein
MSECRLRYDRDDKEKGDTECLSVSFVQEALRHPYFSQFAQEEIPTFPYKLPSEAVMGAEEIEKRLDRAAYRNWVLSLSALNTIDEHSN